MTKCLLVSSDGKDIQEIDIDDLCGVVASVKSIMTMMGLALHAEYIESNQGETNREKLYCLHDSSLVR